MHTDTYKYFSMVICCVDLYVKHENPPTLNDFLNEKNKVTYEGTKAKSMWVTFCLQKKSKGTMWMHIM